MSTTKTVVRNNEWLRSSSTSQHFKPQNQRFQSTGINNPSVDHAPNDFFFPTNEIDQWCNL
ncbi:hypothetical protein OROGR_024201 [Orobanche gracilis]